ncbi:hypothetical protein ACQKI4_23210, partial [Paenibacillus glucanolyticus]|uniref:hypothetical protein n=1 Tax=Paenibacillus glucanolyticus TaxID=59843 RepID=UPI003D039664
MQLQDYVQVQLIIGWAAMVERLGLKRVHLQWVAMVEQLQLKWVHPHPHFYPAELLRCHWLYPADEQQDIISWLP